MTSPILRAESRRHFLQYLAASPLLGSLSSPSFGGEARVAMQQCGVAAVAELNLGFVRRAS